MQRQKVDLVDGGRKDIGLIWRRAFVFGALACFVIALGGCTRPQIVSGVDATSIRSIQIGMTEQEVTAILGEPLQVRPGSEIGIIYDYATPGLAFVSSRLWIYFENGTVHTVQAKRYPLMGEARAVYEARVDRLTAFQTAEFESTFHTGR